ncbi:putative nuclease [Megavirus courdo7]|uniref:Putative nuclease n=1 Tax=Megavirus courdo7 TaxID=1128135 RepID=H2EB31_9VIRU|nr:putative nuclease [Megavirus courdo7]
MIKKISKGQDSEIKIDIIQILLIEPKKY